MYVFFLFFFVCFFCHPLVALILYQTLNWDILLEVKYSSNCNNKWWFTLLHDISAVWMSCVFMVKLLIMNPVTDCKLMHSCALGHRWSCGHIWFHYLLEDKWCYWIQSVAFIGILDMNLFALLLGRRNKENLSCRCHYLFKYYYSPPFVSELLLKYVFYSCSFICCSLSGA